MDNKIVGYVLLVIGILLIIITVINVFLVFTGSKKPYQFLNENASLAQFSMDIPETGGVPMNAVPITINNNAQITKIINLVLYIIFAGFFAGIGYKLAMIGTNLVRPIIVKTDSLPDKSTSKPSL